jgi:hypothetical protein
MSQALGLAIPWWVLWVALRRCLAHTSGILPTESDVEGRRHRTRAVLCSSWSAVQSAQASA